jgi:hypothetical protein
MTYIKPMRHLMLGWVLLGAIAVLGCASDKPSGSAPPPPKPVGLGQIKSELLEAKAQIDTTSGALNTLAKSAAPDAQTNYNKFSEEYTKLKTKADAIKARANDLKKKTSDYYATWNKQMEVENPELRTQAVQKKADAERVYNSISSEMELARIAFNPYMSNLKDVGNYLRGNLTPASLASVSDLVTKANGQSKAVQTHLDAIVASIDKMAAATGESAAAPALK